MNKDEHPVMRCQQCDRDTLPGAIYCHSCGWQVQPQCQTCSTFNPSGSHFCSNCGMRFTRGEAASTAGRSIGVGTKAPPRAVICPGAMGTMSQDQPIALPVDCLW